MGALFFAKQHSEGPVAQKTKAACRFVSRLSADALAFALLLFAPRENDDQPRRNKDRASLRLALVGRRARVGPTFRAPRETTTTCAETKFALAFGTPWTLRSLFARVFRVFSVFGRLNIIFPSAAPCLPASHAQTARLQRTREQR